MIKCITEWMPKWKKNGWRLSTGGEVKNKDQLVELDGAIKEGVDVKWVSLFVKKKGMIYYQL